MRQPIPILMYHSVSDQADQRYQTWNISPAEFAAQMTYLRTAGYNPIGISTFVAALRQEGPLPERPVVLTFDDGLADFATGALPILVAHQFPATLYVVTGYVGQTSRWLADVGEGDRRMLTWAALQDLRSAGIECGGHTHSHRPLDLLPPAVARQEIVSCKALLEQQLGGSVEAFAYPYGFFNLRVRRMVREAGYTSACAVLYGPSALADDRFALARQIVLPGTTPAAFATLLQAPIGPGGLVARRIRALLGRAVRRPGLRAQYQQEQVPDAHDSAIG